MLRAIFYSRYYRNILLQAIILLAVGIVFYNIYKNTTHNIQTRGLNTGFEFLDQPSRFDIDTGFYSFEAQDSNWSVLTAGLINTGMVAFFGIISATILGFVIGILRLSTNLFIQKLSLLYVDILRNLPLLLQILIIYSFLLYLPNPTDSLQVGSFYLNSRYLTGPKVISGAYPTLFVIMVVGMVIAFMYHKYIQKHQLLTGHRKPLYPVFLILLVVMVVTFFMFDYRYEVPEMEVFNHINGWKLDINFIALWLGLTLYTSAFIAEIVRSGIMAINKGMSEAGQSLGLTYGQNLRLVILPLAIRVIIPPMTSQYLNLTKNSSLATVVGYPDLVSIFSGTTLNITGQAIETIAISMLVYLSFSLSISLLMNWFNKKMRIVER